MRDGIGWLSSMPHRYCNVYCDSSCDPALICEGLCAVGQANPIFAGADQPRNRVLAHRQILLEWNIPTLFMLLFVLPKANFPAIMRCPRTNLL